MHLRLAAQRQAAEQTRRATVATAGIQFGRKQIHVLKPINRSDARASIDRGVGAGRQIRLFPKVRRKAYATTPWRWRIHQVTNSRQDSEDCLVVGFKFPFKSLELPCQ